MDDARLLIVEDDSAWQEIYRRCLDNGRYHIRTAHHPQAALDLLANEPFDLILTDLKMLGGTETFSGFGVLERAKQINPNMPVIVITGYGSADHAIRAMRSGAYDFITKDGNLLQKLRRAVRGALEMQALKQSMLGQPLRPIGLAAAIDPSRLRQQLDTYFDDSELRDLCADLNVTYENLAGAAKRDKVRELVQYLHRRSRLPELLRHLRALRPKVSWS